MGSDALARQPALRLNPISLFLLALGRPLEKESARDLAFRQRDRRPSYLRRPSQAQESAQELVLPQALVPALVQALVPALVQALVQAQVQTLAQQQGHQLAEAQQQELLQLRQPL